MAIWNEKIVVERFVFEIEPMWFQQTLVSRTWNDMETGFRGFFLKMNLCEGLLNPNPKSIISISF